nr:hypothetical protein [Bacillus dakarensis]
MHKLKFWILLFIILFAFVFNLLGLMKLVPLLITSPILFIAFLLFFLSLNDRNRFKGFRN